MTIPSIGIVIVLYNRLCSDSLAIASLRQVNGLDRCRIQVIDNSDQPAIVAQNHQACRDEGRGYLAMGENAGLPRAYNAGIALLKAEVSLVMLLDDDTVVPQDSLDRLHASFEASPDAAIHIPIVEDDRGLLSPCVRWSSLFRRLKHRPDTFRPQMSAINSGMVLRLDRLSEWSPIYDEHQFLDYVDHFLVCRAIQARKGISLYEATFRQAFFDSARGVAQPSFSRALTRFGIFVRDFRYYYRHCSHSKAVSEGYLLFRAVRLCLRYRHMAFLQMLRRAKR